MTIALAVRVVDTPLTLVRAQWRNPPQEWVDRLRAISPVSPVIPYLVFHWHTDAERWELMMCIPHQTMMQTADGRDFAARCQDRPWFDLPKGQRMGRRFTVSTYQFEMFRRHQVWARPFWTLQGPNGGTPQCYTALEEAILQAEGLSLETPHVGAFAYAPFDNRAVRAVLMRDRLYHLSGDFEALNRQATPETRAKEQEAAQLAYRKRFLEWWSAEMAPMADFLDRFTNTKAGRDQVRPASRAEASAANRFSDEWVETGHIPAAGPDNTHSIRVLNAGIPKAS